MTEVWDAYEDEERKRKARFEALVQEAETAPHVTVAPVIKPIPRPTGTPMSADELEQALQEELASMRRLRKETAQP